MKAQQSSTTEQLRRLPVNLLVPSDLLFSISVFLFYAYCLVLQSKIIDIDHAESGKAVIW